MGVGYSGFNSNCVERATQLPRNARYIVYFTDGVKQGFTDTNWTEFLQHNSYSCSVMKGIDIPPLLRDKHSINPKQMYRLYIPEGCLHLEQNASFYPFRGNLVLVANMPFHSNAEIKDVSDLIFARLNHFQSYATI